MKSALKEMDALFGEASLSKLFYSLSKKGSTLKGKKIAPIGRKLFSFSVDRVFPQGF